MDTRLIGTVFAAAMLAQAGAVFGQSAAVVDLRNFRPREVKSAVFTLASAQDLRVERTSFKLERETQVRIFALGESTGRSLADYGWIEDAKTGKAVWEMTYRATGPGGGASKNRRFDGVVTLPAGEYFCDTKLTTPTRSAHGTPARPMTPKCGGLASTA